MGYNPNLEQLFHYYRPKTRLRQGNVFTPVCDSVHGGGVYPNMQWAGVYTPWTDTSPREQYH